MFNKQTLEILSQLNTITNSIILKYPQTVAVSEAQDILVLFDISEADSDPFEPIALKNSLGDLLGLVKMFPEERDITLENKTIHVNSDNMNSTFIMDNIALMDAYDKDPIQFQKTEAAPSVATFDLSSEDMKNIKAGSSVFKDLSEVIFTSQDGDMNVSLGATNKFNAKSNTFSVQKAAETSKEFSIKIPVENFKMLPQSDYTIDVKYNSNKNSFRIILVNKTITSLKILMTVKA